MTHCDRGVKTAIGQFIYSGSGGCGFESQFALSRFFVLFLFSPSPFVLFSDREKVAGGRGGGGGGERESETDRQTDRQAGRQAGRQRDTDRQTDREGV